MLENTDLQLETQNNFKEEQVSENAQDFEVVEYDHPVHGLFEVEVDTGLSDDQIKKVVGNLDLDLLLGLEQVNETEVGETQVEKLKEFENSAGAGRKGGKWYGHESLEGGTQTIAYGHKLTPEEAKSGFISINGELVDYRQGLSQDHAEAVLKADTQWAQTHASASLKKIGMEEDEGKLQAITSLIYNVGSGSWGSSKAKKFLEAGNIEDFMHEAFSEEAGFVNINGEYSRGLARRRKEEAGLFAQANINEGSPFSKMVSEVLNTINPISTAQAADDPKGLPLPTQDEADAATVAAEPLKSFDPLTVARKAGFNVPDMNITELGQTIAELLGPGADVKMATDASANIMEAVKSGDMTGMATGLAEMVAGLAAVAIPGNQAGVIKGVQKTLTPPVANRPIMPAPQRFFDETNKDFKPFLKDFDYTAGGRYIEMSKKGLKDVTAQKPAAARISVAGDGKQSMLISEELVETTGSALEKGSTLVKTNLLKRGVGWKWGKVPKGYDPNPANNFPLVSIETKQKHYFTVDAQYPAGVDLSRYADNVYEPRLRPTTKGKVTLGKEIGTMTFRGRTHPVYDNIIVKSAVPIAIGTGVLSGLPEEATAAAEPSSKFGTPPRKPEPEDMSPPKSMADFVGNLLVGTAEATIPTKFGMPLKKIEPWKPSASEMLDVPEFGKAGILSFMGPDSGAMHTLSNSSFQESTMAALREAHRRSGDSKSVGYTDYPDTARGIPTRVFMHENLTTSERKIMDDTYGGFDGMMKMLVDIRTDPVIQAALSVGGFTKGTGEFDVDERWNFNSRNKTTSNSYNSLRNIVGMLLPTGDESQGPKVQLKLFNSEQ